MSTFWKPVGPRTAVNLGNNPMKLLGHGLYALWARCDLCCYSGAFHEFTLFERRGQSGSVCAQCCGDEVTVRWLLDTGWEAS